MRKIREVLRLYHECGLSQRQIAASCRLGKTAVHDCIRRAEDAGLSWPLPVDVDDVALEARLYPGPGRLVGRARRGAGLLRRGARDGGPGQPRGGLNRAHRYDPEINVAYAELASHYGLAVVPARAGRSV